MADYYLQITGIAGESKEAKHKDWIDVLSWSFGESNAGTMPRPVAARAPARSR